MRVLCAFIALILFGCTDENPQENLPDSTPASVSGEAYESALTPSNTFDECLPADTDYLPRTNASADDNWESCISDSGVYSQLELSVSSIERVAGADAIADLLWRRDTVPSPDDFLQARDIYTVEQGLRTRVMRRFDPHYDAPPDGNLSCGDESTYLAYPEYCVGPSTIGPLITNAFINGIEGIEPLQNAARIEAGLLWFLYVSTIKEAHTCIDVTKDCDSSWAYYSGGTQRDGPLGLAAVVDALSSETHDRVFDGILALRCWRDLDQTTPAENLELWQRAIDQIDQALLHGMSLILRQKALQVECSTGDYADAHRSFLEFTGPLFGKLMADYPQDLSDAWESPDFSPSEVDELIQVNFICP
ncbi:MAG: hypothetical protein HOK28_03800 [Deltaproteobacteria bacterium]|nr:hypothetical protein [Deltaproteobacteria bacterium]